MSGAALQGYLRNPLASRRRWACPTARHWARWSRSISGFAAQSEWALPVFAIASALLAMVVLMGLARLSESALTLILGGIAIGTLSGAAISLALNLSSNPFAAMEIAFWMLGSVEDRSIQQVFLVVPFAAVSAALLLWDRKALDALTLGEETAQFARLRLEARRTAPDGGCRARRRRQRGGQRLHRVRRTGRAAYPAALDGIEAIAAAHPVRSGWRGLLTAADVLVRLIPPTAS